MGVNRDRKAKQKRRKLKQSRVMTGKLLREGLYGGKVTQQQALVLRVAWPVSPGWESQVIGRSYPERTIQIFLTLRGRV